MPELVDYLENIDKSKVKKVAVITSCLGEKDKKDLIREILAKNNIEVLPDEFICKGSFLVSGKGHPSETEIRNAVDYAKKWFKLVSQRNS